MRSAIETNTGMNSSFIEKIKDKLIFIKNDFVENRTSYLFLAPFYIIFFIFTILPVIIAIILSCTHYNMLEPPQWVGLQNYLKLFLDDEVFLIAIKNTIVFAIVTGPVSYTACLLLAWMINELQPKIRAFLTLIFYAPALTGMVYYVARLVFDGSIYGYANSLLLYWGYISEPIQFLKDARYIMPVAIITVIWSSLGTSFLAFIGDYRVWMNHCMKQGLLMVCVTAGRSCGILPCRR